MSADTTQVSRPARRDSVLRWLRRLMGIADAGVSSLGNLATNILAARTLLDPEQFGMFSITMLLGIILIGVSRSLCGDPLTLLHSADDEADRRHAMRGVVGAALTGSVLALPLVTLVVTVVMVASRGQWGQGLQLGLALAVVLPLLVGQELVRSVAYASARPPAAFANSFSWTLFLVVALVVVRPASAPVFILIWGLTAGAGLLVGMLMTRIGPRRLSPLSWYREGRELSKRLLVDFALTQVTAEGSVVLISMIAGAMEAGLIRKAQIPLTPVIVLTNGMIAMAQPALVRQVASGRPPHELRRSIYRVGGAALAGSLLLGLLVWLVPTRWMTVIVGSQWGQARRLVPTLSLYLGIGALAAAQGVALRALGQLGGQLRLRFVLTPVSLVLVFVSAFGGAFWATVGLCASLVCVAGAWAWLLDHPLPRRAAQE